MSSFLTPYPWTAYSQLLIERILNPKNCGSFPNNAGAMQEMRVVRGIRKEGINQLIFYLVVDESDGIIADVKFQALGASPLIGAADAASEILMRKNYEQAKHITAELIDRKVRDFENIPAFPDTAACDLNLVLEAIDDACEKCSDIPITGPSFSPPVPSQVSGAGEHSEWNLLNHEEKLELVRKVIATEVQPYVEMDAGGIEVQELKENGEVVVAYQGACTSCPSATGATLSAIQEILRARVCPHLIVKPDLSLLT